MMRKHSLCRLGAFLSRGFTLVEAIIVLVVLAIASVTIATLTGTIFNSQDNNKDLQVGMQLMQECAEQVLARSRAGPSGFTSPDCPGGATSGMTSASIGFSGTPTVTPTDVSPPNEGCPSGATCKLVTVSVSTVSGATLTPITLLLVK